MKPTQYSTWKERFNKIEFRHSEWCRTIDDFDDCDIENCQHTITKNWVCKFISQTLSQIQEEIENQKFPEDINVLDKEVDDFIRWRTTAFNDGLFIALKIIQSHIERSEKE